MDQQLGLEGRAETAAAESDGKGNGAKDQRKAAPEDGGE